MALKHDDTLKVRTIRNKIDGVKKRYTREAAAKLVYSGKYEYSDNGPDDTEEYKASWNRQTSFSKVEKKDAELVGVRDLKIKSLSDDKNTGSKPRSKIDMSKMTAEQRQRLRLQQHVVATNNPPRVEMTKGIDTLRQMIDRTKEKRRQRTA